MSRFTLTIMQLATSELDAPDTKTIVKTYDADGKLKETQVTTEEPDEETDDKSEIIESGAHMDPTSPTLQRKFLKTGGNSPRQIARTPKQARKRSGT